MADLFDTNILIDLLDGRPEALSVVRASNERAISIVTRIELLSGTSETFREQDARLLLNEFFEEPLSSAVAEAAIRIRRLRTFKLPDAIILATARVSGRTMITRDVKAFGKEPGIRLPYQL